MEKSKHLHHPIGTAFQGNKIAPVDEKLHFIQCKYKRNDRIWKALLGDFLSKDDQLVLNKWVDSIPAATERNGTLLRPLRSHQSEVIQWISTSIEFLLDVSSREGTGERRNPVRYSWSITPRGSDKECLWGPGRGGGEQGRDAVGFGGWEVWWKSRGRRRIFGGVWGPEAVQEERMDEHAQLLSNKH